jgi:hypothetical protein
MRITFKQFLLNNGSREMATKAQATPVAYSYAPLDQKSADQGQTAVAAINALICVFQYTGPYNFKGLGPGPALVNGLLLQATIAGVVTNIATIFDNSDLFLTFNPNPLPSDSLSPAFACKFVLSQQIILTNTDSISATIQDDMSAFVNFSIGFEAEKDI